MELSGKRKIIYGILGLLLVWAVILMFSWIQFTPKSDTASYVPDQANIVVKINNPTIIKQTAYNLLFSEKISSDDLAPFANLVSDDGEGNGLHFESDCFLFMENWKNHDILGIIVGLEDEELFAKNFISEENTIVVHNKSTGIILNIITSNDIDISLFNNYAQDLINGKVKNATTKLSFLENHSNNSLLEYYIKGHNRSFMQDITGDVEIENNHIVINAQANRNTIFSHDKILDFKAENRSKEKAFELTSGKLPDTIMRFFQKTLNEADIILPPVQSQNIQYYGSKIQNIEGKMMIQPQFDGIFRFYNDVDVKESSQKFAKLNERVMDSDSSHIIIGSTTYYLHQINDDHIYIGIHENYQFDFNSTSTVFEMNGDIKRVFDLEGDNFMVRLANIYSPFKNSKWLSNQIEDFNVRATPDEGFNSLKIEGEISFKENRSPALVLAEYFIRMTN